MAEHYSMHASFIFFSKSKKESLSPKPHSRLPFISYGLEPGHMASGLTCVGDEQSKRFALPASPGKKGTGGRSDGQPQDRFQATVLA